MWSFARYRRHWLGSDDARHCPNSRRSRQTLRDPDALVGADKIKIPALLRGGRSEARRKHNLPLRSRIVSANTSTSGSITVGRNATISDAAQKRSSQQTEGTWYPWERSIVVVPKGRADSQSAQQNHQRPMGQRGHRTSHAGTLPALRRPLLLRGRRCAARPDRISQDPPVPPGSARSSKPWKRSAASRAWATA